MITRDEYNKALDVVEQYHKQLFIDSLKPIKYTLVLNWSKLDECSTRLRSVLKNVDYHNEIYHTDYYIETLTLDSFKRIRNAGMKSWNEFKELRGY